MYVHITTRARMDTPITMNAGRTRRRDGGATTLMGALG
jgi:hypothetical protein